jgi:hypothetical protein
VRRVTVLAGALPALLACAAVALAATPSKGLRTGTTSQGRKVDVKVGSNHHIRRFRIDWRAGKCDTAHGAWTGGTTVTNPRHQPGDGSFSDSGKYKDNAGGGSYVGHVKFGFSGKFTSSSDANGTFHAKVRVTKNGTTVDHCHTGKLTWTVS